MDLKEEINKFYFSTALCDMHLINNHVTDQSLSHNSQMYLELIYTMEGHCTASDLAEVLGISKVAVTLKVNELINQGLVERTTDPSDRRRKLLTVNEDEVRQYRVYRTQDQQAVDEITARFSKKDIEKFCEMLRVMSDINFQQCKMDRRL